jgi:hypothetical protein
MAATVDALLKECLEDLRATTITARKVWVSSSDHSVSGVCVCLWPSHLTLHSSQRGAASAVKLLESAPAQQYLDVQTKRGADGGASLQSRL